MRAVTAFIALFCMTLAPLDAGTVTSDNRAERKPYTMQNYKHAMVGAHAVARTGAGAVWGEMLGHPREWGRGVGGFGKRLASGFGTHAVSTSIEYGVGHMLHEERSYHRSADPHFGPRLKSALGNTFLVYHRGSDKRHPAVGRLSGAFGAGLISRAWLPASAHTVAAGVGSAGISLGVDFGMNMAREYMPDHHHRRRTSNER